MNRLIIELPEHAYKQLVKRAEKQQKLPEQLAMEKLVAEFGISVRSKSQAKRIAKDFLASCNTYKLAKTDGVDSLTGERARLFNPRLDNWNVHFHLNIHTGQIEGRTPIGSSKPTLLIEGGLFPVQMV